MALLDILDCSMEDLIEPVAAAKPARTARAQPAAPTPGSATCGPGGPVSPEPVS